MRVSPKLMIAIVVAIVLGILMIRMRMAFGM